MLFSLVYLMQKNIALINTKWQITRSHNVCWFLKTTDWTALQILPHHAKVKQAAEAQINSFAIVGEKKKASDIWSLIRFDSLCKQLKVKIFVKELSGRDISYMGTKDIRYIFIPLWTLNSFNLLLRFQVLCIRCAWGLVPDLEKECHLYTCSR